MRPVSVGKSLQSLHEREQQQSGVHFTPGGMEKKDSSASCVVLIAQAPGFVARDVSLWLAAIADAPVCALQDFSRYVLALAAVNTVLFLVVVVWMARHGYKARATLRQLFIMQWYTVQPMWLAVVFVQRAIMQARLRRQGVHVADQQKMLQAAHLDLITFDKTGTLTSDQVHAPSCSGTLKGCLLRV